jgi:hypothetical protein
LVGTFDYFLDFHNSCFFNVVFAICPAKLWKVIMDSLYSKGSIIKGYTEDLQQTLHNQIVSIIDKASFARSAKNEALLVLNRCPIATL